MSPVSDALASVAATVTSVAHAFVLAPTDVMAEPVGLMTILAESTLPVSSATVRHTVEVPVAGTTTFAVDALLIVTPPFTHV